MGSAILGWWSLVLLQSSLKKTGDNYTRELLQLINIFSKVARYKINSNKSVAFLYTKNKQAEKEIRETTPFTIDTNNIKYLGVTLTKEYLALLWKLLLLLSLLFIMESSQKRSYHDCLLKDPKSSCNSQMQIFAPSQWTEAVDPCSCIRGKLKEGKRRLTL